MQPVYILVALTLTCYGDVPLYQNSLQNIRNRKHFQEREKPQIRPIRPLRYSDVQYPRRQATNQRPEDPNFSNTHFCPMPTMAHLGATKLDERTRAEKYPWIARVVAGHRKNSRPPVLLCTAAAVREKVFITAARCIITAKAEFTQVVYQEKLIGVRVFLTVAPEELSKQLFDDVAFIVTWVPWYKAKVNYTTCVPLKMTTRKNDNSYDFFEELAANDYTLVGFLKLKDSPNSYDVFQLDNMHASNSVCNKIYPAEDNSTDYWAPCIHSCDPKQHSRESPDSGCYRYMFGLGHLVLNKKGELIGIVTWTCGNHAEERSSRKDLPLPLGIAVPNKKTLGIELGCAHHITTDDISYRDLTLGYHWILCSNQYG